jgi:proliferating cell nuclear antigen PCNA
MEIQINQPSNAEIFSGLFQYIKLFTNDINIHFETERLFIQALDTSRVSIFEVYLPKSWFDVYNISDGNGAVVGINTNNLYKVLHAREKNQRLTMKMDDTSDDKILLDMTSDNPTIFDKHFELPLMDIDTEMMHIPSMEYKADFSLPSNTFATLIDQLKMFGETLRIECSEDKIQLFSESLDSGKMSVDIPIDDLVSFAIEEDEQLDISFALTYLHNICLYSKLAKTVDISMTTNYPIRIQYLLDDSDAKIVYYLAPKIDD